MTSAPVRGPLADHLLTPQNAALLLIGLNTEKEVVNVMPDATSTGSARAAGSAGHALPGT